MTPTSKQYDIIGRKGGTHNGYVIKPLLDEVTGKASNNGRITVDEVAAQKHIESQPYFGKTVIHAKTNAILFKNASTNNQIAPKVPAKAILINPLQFNSDDMQKLDAAIDIDPNCIRLMRENVLAIAADRLGEKPGKKVKEPMKLVKEPIGVVTKAATDEGKKADESDKLTDSDKVTGGQVSETDPKNTEASQTGTEVKGDTEAKGGKAPKAEKTPKGDKEAKGNKAAKADKKK